MGMSPERLVELAQLMAAHMGPRRVPELRLAGSAERASPALPVETGDRSVLIRRIRDMERLHDLGWLVRQETAHAGFALARLETSELSALFDRLWRAIQCPVEDVSYFDAGLLRQ